MRRILTTALSTLLTIGCLAGCVDGNGGATDTTVADAADTTVADAADTTVADTADTTVADTEDTTDTESDTDVVAPVVRTLSVKIGPFSVAAGQEQTKCVSVDLGNVDPGLIRAVRTDLTPGSHHMIVHRLSGDADPSPVNCSAFAHGASSDLVFIAQSAEAELNYPPQSGLPAKAHQTIGLEMHYINYFGEDAVDITGTVEFDLIDEVEGYDPVRVLFTGPLGFVLPKDESDITHFQGIDPSWRIFAMTSHTHQLGIHATISRAMSQSQEGTMIHESFNWAEAPLDTFDPLLQLDANEGLKLVCTYDNDTGSYVTFGTGFDDEMCFMWLYYLP